MHLDAEMLRHCAQIYVVKTLLLSRYVHLKLVLFNKYVNCKKNQ